MRGQEQAKAEVDLIKSLMEKGLVLPKVRKTVKEFAADLRTSGNKSGNSELENLMMKQKLSDAKKKLREQNDKMTEKLREAQQAGGQADTHSY